MVQAKRCHTHRAAGHLHHRFHPDAHGQGLVYRLVGASSSSNIAWRSNLADAMAEARQTGRPILVDFSADWCPPCRVMQHDVWPNDEVEALANTHFIPVMIDVDANQADAMQYNISSIPTVAVLNPDGTEIAREGFMSRSAMVRFLSRHALPSTSTPPSRPVPTQQPDVDDQPKAVPAAGQLMATTR